MKSKLKYWLDSEHVLVCASTGAVLVNICGLFLIICIIFIVDPLKALLHGASLSGTYHFNTRGQWIDMPIGLSLACSGSVLVVLCLIITAILIIQNSKTETITIT